MIKFPGTCNGFELLYFKRIAIFKVDAEVDDIAVSCSYLILK